MRRRAPIAVLSSLLVVAGCTHDFDVFDVSGAKAPDAGTGGGGTDGAAPASGGATGAASGGAPDGGVTPDTGGSGGGGSSGSDGGVAKDAGDASSGGAPGDGGPCGATEKLCGSGCVSTSQTATGCGAPSCSPCSLANATAYACTLGACFPTSCVPGFGNCNGTAGDGCEHDTAGDPLTCGDCGRVCSTDHVQGLACAGGRCTSACEPGRANCNHPQTGADDGCEVDATSDAQNCGGCGNDCTQQTGKSCAASLCGCTSDSSCRSGPQQGTTSCDTGTNLCHCNGATCQHGESCRQGACMCNGGSACADGQTCCRSPSGCKNLQTDPESCGACGHACTAGFVCTAGACECDADPDCDGGTAGTCSGGVCHCGASTCQAGERCLPNGQCG